MESDSISDYDKQKKKNRNSSIDDGDVPEPSGLCRVGSRDYEPYWMGLLDYNTFTLCVGCAIVLAFFLCS